MSVNKRFYVICDICSRRAGVMGDNASQARQRADKEGWRCRAWDGEKGQYFDHCHTCKDKG